MLAITSVVVYLVVSLFVAISAAQAPGAARTVWDGVFTEEQAARGRAAFGEHCSSCHGDDLQGGEAKALAGDRFWTDWKETTVDYLLGQISKNMPFSEDGSLAGTLPASTYAAVVAHILKANGFPAGTQELTTASSAGVSIVAKEGPGELPASALGHVVGCLARGTGGTWRLVKGAPPTRVLSGRAPDPHRPLGDREYGLMFVITSLEKFVGHRMSVVGRLIGDGGVGGLNVTTITAVSNTCE